MRCRAERSCLRVLEGGCSVPVGVETVFVNAPLAANESASTSPDSAIPGNDSSSLNPYPTSTTSSTKGERYPKLTLTGSVTSLDGRTQVIFTSTADMTCFADAEALGEAVAHQLIKGGARAILDEVNKERAIRDAALKEQKKSKSDKGLSLPPSIAGSSAASGETILFDAQVASVIDSAMHNTAPTATTHASPIIFLPQGHPPIPGSPTAALQAHPPAISLPPSTIDDATPLLPASHPPILVTPSRDQNAEIPTHCLRPATPPPPPTMQEVTAEALDAGVCLRPPTPEVVEHVLRGGMKRKADASDNLGDNSEVEQPVSPSSSKRRLISSSSGRGRDMQG